MLLASWKGWAHSYIGMSSRHKIFFLFKEQREMHSLSFLCYRIEKIIQYFFLVSVLFRTAWASLLGTLFSYVRRQDTK